MTQKKTHWKKLRNPDYLGAYDFEDNEKRTLQIKDVIVKAVKNAEKEEDCTVINFTTGKPMICNATNAKMIAKITGSVYIEDWARKSITIVVKQVKAFGDIHQALRVAPEVPKSTKPKLEFPSETFTKAKEAIANKTYSLEKIKEKYEVSPQIEKMLCDKQ